jgi:uncharacterized surface protein with fasciclin (FAS1) repeats
LAARCRHALLTPPLSFRLNLIFRCGKKIDRGTARAKYPLVPRQFRAPVNQNGCVNDGDGFATVARTRTRTKLVSGNTKSYSLKPAFGAAVARGNDEAVKTKFERFVVAFIAGFETPAHLILGRRHMSKRIALLTAAAFGAFALTASIVAPVTAQEKTVMVGGAAMFPSKNIIQNAVNSKDHTTLVAAVKAAGLVETLEGKGPFTVFAPTNEAFGKLPAGTVDTLVKPENKATLTKILTYHVVAGKLEASDLTDGKKLKTVQGEDLTVKRDGDNIMIIDAKGGSSMITIKNVNQSNGVIQVVDTVLMPS